VVVLLLPLLFLLFFEVVKGVHHEVAERADAKISDAEEFGDEEVG
jgi:hypothetical protein